MHLPRSPRQVIGVYPAGELYNNGATQGWNTGLQRTPPDPDDMAYVGTIVGVLRQRGALGRLYAFGSSNGGALALRIGTNSGMGFSGIITMARPTELNLWNLTPPAPPTRCARRLLPPPPPCANPHHDGT